ncbi:hypothetical protein PFAG_01622 [Plasmodium falciparum Santa Lucia]|uniref:Uncharacterized protein n=1 Tax=Plasmodium falciparum Santa Lucia TaxID=478859 RepID=W7FT15_PLAFA|nr:hypothetical protein PFAG_01622 [Plasmodium falciparum Santa Lucia]
MQKKKKKKKNSFFNFTLTKVTKSNNLGSLTTSPYKIKK